MLISVFWSLGEGGICLGQLDRNIVLAFVCILAETQEHGTYLRLLYGGVVSVAHGRDVQPSLPLPVPLQCTVRSEASNGTRKKNVENSKLGWKIFLKKR